MKYLIILFLIASCGTKNKVDVGGHVEIPTEFIVKHKFSYDVTAIEEACFKLYENQEDNSSRSQKIDKCISDKELMMEQLFNVLSGKGKLNEKV